MFYLLYIIFSLFSFSFGNECEIDPIPEETIMEGQYIISKLKYLEENNDLLSLSNNIFGISYASLLNDQGPRKKPDGPINYYTINGNKDITILGYEKQNLYNNSTYEWNEFATFTLNVSNVGYLTYNGITLCDINELNFNTDYSEFINNVTLNGFSSKYEYRLELNNGHVILWSKLPGNPIIPEPKTLTLLLIGIILLNYKSKRI